MKWFKAQLKKILLKLLRKLFWPVFWPLVCIIALKGCGAFPTSDGFYGQKDGAPARPIDVSMVRDAVPRVEPFSKYGNPDSYVVNRRRYHVLKDNTNYTERGIASWYGTKFHGKRTSSGEPYDMYAMTAAHKSLPLPTYARVTNLENGRSVVVKINDRGPFSPNRIIDLSYSAASKLGILKTGTALVEINTIDPGHKQVKKPVLKSAQHDFGLYLQIAAFSNPQNAEELRSRLMNKTSSDIQVSRAQQENKEIYRVRIGPISDIDEADRMSKLVIAEGLGEPRIIID